MSLGTIPLRLGGARTIFWQGSSSGATVSVQAESGTWTERQGIEDQTVTRSDPREPKAGPDVITGPRLSLRGIPRQMRQQEYSADALTSEDFALTLSRVQKLRSEEDEEDRPSPYAYNRAVDTLRKAAKDLGFDFPRGIAAAGPNNSLRLLWSRGGR